MDVNDIKPDLKVSYVDVAGVVRPYYFTSCTYTSPTCAVYQRLSWRQQILRKATTRPMWSLNFSDC